MEPYVIVPCSGAKAADDRLAAADRYTGSFHRLAMQAALRLTRPEWIRIASARYGLIALEEVTEPYDRRLDELGFDDLRQWQGWVQCDAGGMWSVGRYAVRTMNGLLPRAGRPGAPVILLTPRFYTEQLLLIPLIARHAVQPLPFEGCAGIGEMRHVLSTYTWTDPERPPMPLAPRASNCPDLTTEDNRTPIVPGQRLFNYYDCKWGRVGDRIDPDGWFDFIHDDGSRALLNGVRVSTTNPRG